MQSIQLTENGLKQDKRKSWTFSQLKRSFCEYWTLVKIKISMSCMYKECEIKIKLVQKQRLQIKMAFLLGYNLKIFI